MSNKPQSMLYLLDTSGIFIEGIIDGKIFLKTERFIRSSREVGLLLRGECLIPDTIILLGVGDNSDQILRETLTECKERYPNMYPPTIIDGRTRGFELRLNSEGKWDLAKKDSDNYSYRTHECQRYISDCRMYLENFIRRHWKTSENFPEYHSRLFKN